MRDALLIVGLLCFLPVSAQGIHAHLRVDPSRGALAGWQDAQGHYVTVRFDDPRAATDWDGAVITISTDSASFSARTMPGVPVDAVSLLLDATPDSTVLYLAAARDRQRFVVHTAMNLATRPATVVQKCKVLRDDCTIDAPQAAPLRATAFADVAALMTYLNVSDDPSEGLWRYFDHKTAPLLASLGGTYTLATVRCPDSDDFHIIYIHGSDNPDWQPLDIKGFLKATPIQGMYDLQWFTDDRISIATHSWATIDGLLTLNFPHWDATLRLAPCKKE